MTPSGLRFSSEIRERNFSAAHAAYERTRSNNVNNVYYNTNKHLFKL